MEPVKVYLALILIGVLFATCESTATEEYTGVDADSSLQPRGWNIPPARTAPCGSHTLFPGQIVNIKSANYPRKYPRKHFCKWMFQVTSPDSTITLTCNRFRLSSVKKSFMLVIAGSVKKRYHGKPSLPIAVTSSDNTMEVTFRTSSAKKRRRKGFTCRVSASRGSCCANKMVVVDSSFPVGTNDTFETGNYPNNYTDGCFCCLYTQIAQNATVRFTTQPGDATYRTPGANCSQSDRLDFNDFGSNVMSLCGPLDLLTSLGNQDIQGPKVVQICFTSMPGDGNQVAKGFRVTVSREPEAAPGV